MRGLILIVAIVAGVAGVLAAAACGERSLKAAGQECRATSECESGLLCDFGATPAVCAGEGSGPRPMIDAAPLIDAGPIDAPIDAPVDAALDAAIDAMI